MNRQEIFDTVAKHLFTQGRPATDSENCVYRGPNGTKCAVGVLIPDDVYIGEMEGAGVILLFEAYKNVLPSWFEDNLDLLRDLQQHHDFCDRNKDQTFDLDDLASRLRLTADMHDLNADIVGILAPKGA